MKQGYRLGSLIPGTLFYFAYKMRKKSGKCIWISVRKVEKILKGSQD